MATIKAFRGYRPAKELAEKVASRPYDVLNRAEALEESNPHSYLHIIRAEIDLPELDSPYDEAVYKTAKKNFEQFAKDEILVQDSVNCLYVYAQTMNGKRQVGLMTCTSNEDYQNDIIKKHEFTRPKKEQDRINHISTTRLHSGPVLMAYPQVNTIDAVIDQVTQKQAPEYDFTADDGIQHTLWVIDDVSIIQTLVDLFDSEVEAIYIADGHHRAASSAKVGLKLKEENENHTGNEGYNFFLSVLFPDNQLQIIDYNRLVKDLNGLSTDDFLQQVAQKFDVEATGMTQVKPRNPYTFGMYMEGEWYQLTAKEGTYNTSDPIDSLDISVLSDNLIAPILGIKDQRTDDRIDFVGGIRGMKELEKRVNSGEMQVAFSIYAVSIQQLIDVANSGNVMPPKTTWFEPKLRSGLVTHKF
ncbi:MAG: DUF1015 domain-containing protein [Chitinophagales bacterium]